LVKYRPFFVKPKSASVGFWVAKFTIENLVNLIYDTYTMTKIYTKTGDPVQCFTRLVLWDFVCVNIYGAGKFKK